jgi:hypothetical protein
MQSTFEPLSTYFTNEKGDLPMIRLTATSIFLLSVHSMLWAQLELLPPATPQPPSQGEALPSPQDQYSQLEVQLPSLEDVAHDEMVLVAGVPVPRSVKQAFLDACHGKFDARTCEELAIRGCLEVHERYDSGQVNVNTVQRTIPIVLKVYVNKHTVNRQQTQYVDNYDIQIQEIVRRTSETQVVPPTHVVGQVNVRHCTYDQQGLPCPPTYQQPIIQGNYTRQIVQDLSGHHYFRSSIQVSQINQADFINVVQQYYPGCVVTQHAGFLYFHGISPAHVSQLEQRYTNTFHQMSVDANHRLTLAERFRLRANFHQDVNSFMRNLRRNNR